MKNSTTICLAAILLLCGCDQKKNEFTVLGWGTGYASYPEFLKGKVKEIDQKTYWAVVKDGKVEKGLLVTEKENRDSGLMEGFHAVYNPSGKLIRTDYYGDKSNIRWSIVNEFKDGRVNMEKWMRNDTLFSRSFFYYDDKGFIDSILNVDVLADTNNFLLVITNDDKGNFIRNKVFNSKRIYTGYGKYLRDEAGRPIKISDYTPQDSLLYLTVIDLNENGFWKTIQVYDKNNKNIYNTTGDHTYDDKGNWTRAVWSRKSKPWLIDERTYIYY